MKVLEKKQPQVLKILDARVKKSTINEVYKENLVKWMDLSKVEENWIFEGDFKNIGISTEFLSLAVP